jgi:hypothetical protein
MTDMAEQTTSALVAIAALFVSPGVAAQPSGAEAIGSGSARTGFVPVTDDMLVGNSINVFPGENPQ